MLTTALVSFTRDITAFEQSQLSEPRETTLHAIEYEARSVIEDHVVAATEGDRLAGEVVSLGHSVRRIAALLQRCRASPGDLAALAHRAGEMRGKVAEYRLRRMAG